MAVPRIQLNLSESPEYRAAVVASTAGELSVAREAYQHLLDQAEDDDDVIAISHLLQSLANIEARDGNLELAHELHLRAIGQSPGIPLTIIRYAKSLATHFAMAELAEEKLSEAEKMIDSERWNRAVDSISRETYELQISQLRDEYFR